MKGHQRFPFAYLDFPTDKGWLVSGGADGRAKFCRVLDERGVREIEFRQVIHWRLLWTLVQKECEEVQ